MLENSKCILVYGLNNEELEKLKMANLKLIQVTPEMAAMKVNDIINDIRILKYNDNMPKEKLILFNNCESKELDILIRYARQIIIGVILAIVTPITENWTFEYLLAHLIKEREWIESRQEGS